MSLNPTDGDLAGTRLASFIRAFKKYEFLDLEIMAEPEGPATQTGAFGGYMNCDPADNAPQSGQAAIQSMSASPGCDVWNSWEVGAVCCPDVRQSKMLYANQEGSDVRMTSPGNFNLLSINGAIPTTVSIGLYLAYDVEVEIPMANDNSTDEAGGFLALEFQNGAASGTTIWGGTATTSPSQAQPYNNSLGVTWAQAVGLNWNFYLPTGKFLIEVGYQATASTATIVATKGCAASYGDTMGTSAASSANKLWRGTLVVSDADVAAGVNWVSFNSSASETTVGAVFLNIFPYPQTSALKTDGILQLKKLPDGRVVAADTLQSFERVVTELVRRELDRSSDKAVPWSPVTPNGEEVSPPPGGAEAARKCAEDARAANEQLSRALEALRASTTSAGAGPGNPAVLKRV